MTTTVRSERPCRGPRIRATAGLAAVLVLSATLAAGHPDFGAQEPGPAGPMLRRLAVAALAVQRGGPEPTGRYEFIHTRRWINSLDAFARIEDHQVWWDSDGSMTAVTTPLTTARRSPGSMPTAAGADPDGLAPAGPPLRYHVAGTAGTPRPHMVGPYHRPRDAAELTARLHTDDRADDATIIVFGLAVYYALTAPERAAILTMLAGIDAFRTTGPTTDRHGRTGVAITTRSPVTGHVVALVFDPIGRLLAFIDRPHEASPPSLYHLFITSTHVDHRDYRPPAPDALPVLSTRSRSNTPTRSWRRHPDDPCADRIAAAPERQHEPEAPARSTRLTQIA